MTSTQSPSEGPKPGSLRRLAPFLGWWVILFAFYLLLMDTPEQAEFVAGFLIAAFAVLVLAAASVQRMAPYTPHLSWLVLLARKLPGRAVKDSLIVLGTLWRRIVRHESVKGTFRVLEFDPGGEDQGAAARRALIVAAISLPPNSFVVAMDADAGRILIHHLVPSPQPRGGQDEQWPV